jgi:hypothetical protein
MATYMMRALVNGKMIGHTVEAETDEEAKAKCEEALPLLAQQEADRPPAEARADAGILLKNEGLNGRKFLSIEFQCAACGSELEAEFRDGYLQVSPCPTCLGELESMVAASKRFLERKK